MTPPPLDACNAECWLRRQQEESITKLYEMREMFIKREMELRERLEKAEHALKQYLQTDVGDDGQMLYGGQDYDGNPNAFAKEYFNYVKSLVVGLEK